MVRGMRESLMTGFDWRTEWAQRPWWMNLIFAFCIYMTVVYMPFDLFWKPVEVDQEVWLGVMLHGWAAKATEPLHWAIYAAGAYGFWKMRPWMWPWAAVYLLQITIGMFVFNLLDPRGGGWPGGLVSAAVFLIPTVAMWRSRARFRRRQVEPVATSI